MTYHVLDPTTPWYEWISYLECCKSLNVEPSLNKFIRYNEYYRSVQSTKNQKYY